MTESSMPNGIACRLAGGLPLVLAGNMAYAAAQWLALVVLARWTTADAVGQYALALAVCGPVILFCNGQLAALQSTDGNGQFTFQQYFGVRLITTAFALSLILGVAVAARFESTTLTVLALLAVGKCAEAVSDVVHGALLRRGRFMTLAIALTFNAALSLCGFVVGATVTGQVVWAAAGWAAGSIVTLTVLNCRTAAALDGTHGWPSRGAAAFLSGGLRQRAAIVRLVLTALPMGAISTLLSLQANAPQYVIQHYLGVAAVGTFAVLAYPFMLGNIVVTAMGQAASSLFADALGRSDNAAFRRVLLLTTTMGAALGAVTIAATWLAGRAVVELVYAPEYGRHTTLLLLLAAAAGIRFAYLPIGVAATAMRRIAVQLFVRVWTLAAVIALVSAGARWRGLEGAALALVCVGVVEGMVWLAIALGSIQRPRCSSPQLAPTVS
jgi:O-antigen/teichoic acid export membrane protein